VVTEISGKNIALTNNKNEKEFEAKILTSFQTH
jgi:hypothetical protein